MFSDSTSPLRRREEVPERSLPVWRRWSELVEGEHLPSMPQVASSDDSQNAVWPPVVLHVDPLEWNRVDLYADGEEVRDESYPEHTGDGRAAGIEREPEFSALDLEDPVVTMLLFKQIVTMEDVDRAWRRARSAGKAPDTLWRLLADDPSVNRDRVLAEAAAGAGFTTVRIDPKVARSVMMAQAEAISEQDWKRLIGLGVLPVDVHRGPATQRARLVFAAHDPSRPEVARLLRQLGVGDYELRYAPEADVEAVLQDAAEAHIDDTCEPATAPGARSSPERTDANPSGDASSHESIQPDPSGDASPAERSDDGALLDQCLAAAVRASATAIHVRPSGPGVRIDLRVSGALMPWLEPSDTPPAEVLEAFKRAAQGVDPGDQDIAQVGTMSRRIDGRTYRFAVSVLPLDGVEARECLAIRIHEKPYVSTGVDDLGLSPHALKHLKGAIDRRSGLLVVAGPADSGKSATVEAIQHELDVRSRIVVSLEGEADSVPGVLPARLNSLRPPEDALEAIAHHDPDVVVIGELRNRSAAERALLLAQEGRLVIAKMSVRDGAAVVSRLTRMGVEPLLTAHALALVVAQRYVRRLCSECKVPARHVDGQMLRRLGFGAADVARASFHAPASEGHCGTCGGSGFDGVTLVAEAMPCSGPLRRHIALGEAEDEDDMRHIALREGMETLRAAARPLVAAGETTIEELIRVTAGGH